MIIGLLSLFLLYHFGSFIISYYVHKNEQKAKKAYYHRHGKRLRT
jgi:hypothetical protein